MQTALNETVEVGGETRQLFPVHYGENFDPDSIELATEHMEYAASLGLPELMVERAHKGTCIFVGAAPSVSKHIEEIRRLSKIEGNTLFAVNDANNLLMDYGIIPHANVLFEVAQDIAELNRRHHPQITYYIHSMAHPTTFDAFMDKKVVLFHTYSDVPIHAEKLAKFKTQWMVGGGVSTTMSKTLPLAMFLGFRRFELFGVDSSFEGESHFNGSPYKERWGTIDIAADAGGERKLFKTLPYLARQADEFQRFCKKHHWMLNIKVHGEGLLPWIHKQAYPQMYQESE